MSTFRAKVSVFIRHITHQKFLSIVGIGIIVMAVPLTVYVGQYQQEIRQHASTNQATLTVNPTIAKPGDTVTVSWTIANNPTPTTTNNPTPTIPVVCSPANLVQNNSFESPQVVNTTTQNSWQVYGADTATNTQVTANIPGWDPRAARSGYQVEVHRGLWGSPANGAQSVEIDVPGVVSLTQSIPTQEGKQYQIKFAYSPRPDITSVQKLGVYWNGQQIGTMDGTAHGTGLSWGYKTFTVTGIAGSSKLGFGALSDSNAGAGNLMDDVSVTQVCTSAAGEENTFSTENLIPKAYAQTAITGAESIRLYQITQADIVITPKLIDPKMYLDCQKFDIPGTGANPMAPITPKYIGKCQYTIPTNVQAGGYVFRMYASDGTTILGESTNFALNETTTITPTAGATATPTLPQSSLANGVVAYWKLDETSGKLITNAVGNGFNGKIGTNNSFGAGKIGNALQNPGTSAGAAVPYTAGSALDFTGNHPLSISYWVKVTSLKNHVRLFETPGCGGWGTEYHTDGSFWIINFCSSGTTQSANWPENTVTADSTWHHFGFTYDGTTVTLYKDGVSLGAKPFAPGWTSLARTLVIGGDSAFPLFGAIDEVGVWNRALTIDEIKNLFQGNRYPFPSTCVPRPACLDTEPRCALPEPQSGWCTTVTPTAGATITPTCAPPPACLNAIPSCSVPVPQGGWCTTPPTPTPSTPADLTLIVKLTGIERETSPKRPDRPVTITLIDTNNKVFTVNGSITYDAKSGNFFGRADFSNNCPANAVCDTKFVGNTIPSGNYVIKIKTPQYLQKQAFGIFSFQQGKTLALPLIQLSTGDITGDNIVDILDYNVILNCFNAKAKTTTCTPQNGMPGKEAGDLSDDGIIDGIDYNLFIRGLATKEGD